MSTDHDFSPHNSARDAPAAQSVRKVPWSGMVDGASAGHELPAYTALYGQLGDEELVIRPSGESDNDAEKLENPQVQEALQNRQRRRTIQWKSLRQNP